MKPIESSLTYSGEYFIGNCDQIWYKHLRAIFARGNTQHLFFTWVLFSPKKLKILLRDPSGQVQASKAENLFVIIDPLLLLSTLNLVTFCLAILQKFDQDMLQGLKHESPIPNNRYMHTTSKWHSKFIYVKLLRNMTSI